MSQSTTVLPVLTDKQRFWANAFLTAMGGKGVVQATKAPERVPVRGVTPPQELGGKLGEHESSLHGGVQLAREKLAGKGEDISRKKLIGKSVDKGFKTSVVDPVTAILEAVDAILKRGGTITEMSLPAVTTLRERLVEARTGYQESNRGEKDRTKREQRQRKIDAVGVRLTALDELMRASGGLQQGRAEALAELTPAEKVKLLDDNPEIRKAVIAAKPPAKELAALLAAAPAKVDEFIDEIIKAHGADAAYMEVLCEQCLQAELSIPGKDPATFMRGNTSASKITKVYGASGDGAKYLEEVLGNAKVWLSSVNSERPIEIDPLRIEGTKGDVDRVAEESVDRLIHYVNALLSSLMRADVPRSIATTAGMIAASARKQGRKESDVAIMIGGHVFLRLINPALAAMPSTTPEQKRALILATKVLQNASNGVIRAVKEQYMAPFADMIEDELPGLQAWFLQVARQGDEMRGVPADEETREEWIEELESDNIDHSTVFAAPSVDDPMGLQPAEPNGSLGQLILAELASNAPSTDTRLPQLISPGFLKLVARARAELIGRVTEQLKENRPLVPEDGAALSDLIDAFEAADVNDGTWFAAPSQQDATGVWPADAGSPAGRLIRDDARANPDVSTMLPPNITPGFLKAVTRARTAAIGRIVVKLKAAQ